MDEDIDDLVTAAAIWPGRAALTRMWLEAQAAGDDDTAALAILLALPTDDDD